MNIKFNKLFLFLQENHSYNKELQIKFALNSVSPYDTSFDKLVALLYDTLNTQSQPNIDNIASFMQELHDNKNSVHSFSGFFKFIVGKEIEDIKNNDLFNQLFLNLKTKKGWGPKTSALLVKNIYNYHHNFQNNIFRIWEDVPKLNKSDTLFLPVDAVILAIFNDKLLIDSKPKYNFNNINKRLQELFLNTDVLLFDDLWFWGFITQKGSSKRKFEWNKNKYWMIKESNKDSTVVNQIKTKAEEFLKIIESMEQYE